MAAIFFDDPWSNVLGDDRTREVRRIWERSGMPNAIIVEVVDQWQGRDKTPFKMNTTVYVKTGKYDISGKVIYLLYQDTSPDRYLVYVQTPYKGDDLSGGLISTAPITSGTLPSSVNGDIAAASKSGPGTNEPATAPVSTSSDMKFSFASLKEIVKNRNVQIGALIMAGLWLIGRFGKSKSKALEKG